MVKFTVKHDCGHVVTHVHSGSDADLVRRKERLAARPCTPGNREAKSSKAVAQRQAWNLPPLDGPAEDVEWAEVIRLKAVGENRAYHQRLVGSSKLNQEDIAIRDAIVRSADTALRELHEQRSAVWWIENRFEAVSYVKHRVVAAITPLMEARQQAAGDGEGLQV